MMLRESLESLGLSAEFGVMVMIKEGTAPRRSTTDPRRSADWEQ